MAVVSPVRTLLAAHFQAGWNRSRKELGKTGRAVYVITIAMLLIFAALPTVFGSLMAGYVLGRSLPGPVSVRIFGGILALLTALGGLIGGLAGGTRTLAWESTRIFPLRLRSLFAAELVAGMGDLLPLTVGVLAGFLLLGVGIAKPRLLFFLPLPWLGTMGSLLCIQYLVGSLAARIAKHLRLALMVLAILLWMGMTLLPNRASFAARLGRHDSRPMTVQWEQTLSLGAKTLDVLPSTQCAQGMADLLKSQWGRALGRQVYPLAGVILLLLAAAATLKRESDPQTLRAVSNGVKEKLWSFTSPVQGVARLHWHTLISSHLGKFGFLIPLMVLVLLKGPFAMAKGAAFWSVPVAFAYLSLTGVQLQLNQFGLDGPGVKALLLLPIRSRGNCWWARRWG